MPTQSGRRARGLRLGDLRPSDLVAVRMPPGPAWVDVLRAAWETGAAVLPVDERLPATAAEALVERARPTATFGLAGFERLSGGVPVDAEVRLVMATSATAGPPKLVELTAVGVEAALRASSDRLGAGQEDRWYCCLPLVHMGGMLVALRGVVLGAPLTIAERFDVESFVAAATEGARFASLVPTALERLVRVASEGTGWPRGLRAVLVGGASLDPRLRARCERVGLRIVQTYGMTETCGGIVYDGVPLAGVSVRVEPGTSQILVRSPSTMRSYRLDPEGTAAAFDANGWLRTGDAGVLRDGVLRVEGRLDEVIVTGGEKVWPRAVEEVLRAHASVADVAVMGREDREWGERVVALVVPADPAAPPGLDELRDHARAALPRHALPREVVITFDLPRTGSGKPDRRDPGRRAPEPANATAPERADSGDESGAR